MPCRSARMSLCVCIALRRSADPVGLRGGEDREGDEHHGADDRPAGAPGWSCGSVAPAEHARAGEDREQRGGEQQVAAEDRQARRREHAERADADESRRDRQRRLAAHEGEDEEAAGGRAEQAGLAQDLAEPSRHGQGHVVEAGDALEVLRVALGVDERVQRVAGEDQVVDHPDHGRRGGVRDQARVAFPGGVDDREAPRLGSEEAGEAEQDEHEARVLAARPRRGSRPARARRTGCRSRRAHRSSAPGRG